MSSVPTGQYPALQACLLLDSRYSSRSSILKQLQSTNLFGSLVPAPSLSEGIEILRTTELDLCVLGPSVSPESKRSILEQTAGTLRSKDCAFLALDGEPEQAGYERVHATAPFPCSSSTLFEAVVTAVVTANKESPWRAVRERMTGGEPTAAQQAGENVSALALHLARLQQGVFNFKPDGSPTMTMQKAVREVVDALYPPTEDGANDDFRVFLESALYRWLRDIRLGSAKDATRRLHDALRAYLEIN